MHVVDRLLTIVVTATLTSAAWLVAGGDFLTRHTGSTGPLTAVSQTAASQAPGQAQAAAQATLAAAGTAPVRPGPSGLIIPVQGVVASQLTDTFAAARQGGTRRHDAIDIMAPRGTPVLAAAAGTVEKLFLSERGGKTIYVRSPDGSTIYYYAHLDAYAPGLAEGQAVRQGAVLGAVGSTGDASPDGPHLHFAMMETRPDAKWWEDTPAINPYPLLTGR